MDIEKNTFIIKSTLSIIAFVAGVIIGFIALFLPPQGIIDSSVLWFTAQMMVMGATLLGIDLKMSDLRNKTK